MRRRAAGIHLPRGSRRQQLLRAITPRTAEEAQKLCPLRWPHLFLTQQPSHLNQKRHPAVPPTGGSACAERRRDELWGTEVAPGMLCKGGSCLGVVCLFVFSPQLVCSQMRQRSQPAKTSKANFDTSGKIKWQGLLSQKRTGGCRPPGLPVLTAGDIPKCLERSERCPPGPAALGGALRPGSPRPRVPATAHPHPGTPITAAGGVTEPQPGLAAAYPRHSHRHGSVFLSPLGSFSLLASFSL